MVVVWWFITVTVYPVVFVRSAPVHELPILSIGDRVYADSIRTVNQLDAYYLIPVSLPPRNEWTRKNPGEAINYLGWHRDARNQTESRVCADVCEDALV
jgi:hypothetical protein